MKNSFLSHYQKNLLVFVFSLVSSWLYSQAPTITSFSPTSGAVGATVTITGTGFNTTAANNVVYFDGVKAAVTSTSATQIILTVPSGSSGNSKIKVINLQAGATSSKSQFTTTFFNANFGNGNYSSNAFFGTINFTNGSDWQTTSDYKSIVNCADFNLDGFPDYVNISNNSAIIKVHKNNLTAAGQVITTTSFSSTPTELTGTANSTAVYIEDINLDGKLDLIVLNGSSVDFFINNSTSGTISFSAKQNIVLANGSYRIRFADINSDGLTDIITANSSTISYKLNTSTLGSTVLTFGTTFNITAPAVVSDFDILHLNSDNFLDIVSISSSGYALSLGTNSGFGSFNSTSYSFGSNYGGSGNMITGDFDNDGDVDFANKINTNSIAYFNNNGSATFTAGTASLASASGIFAGFEKANFNGDSFPDFAGSNSNSGGQIAIFNNTTSGSTLGYSASTNAYTSSNPMGLSVCDLNRDGRPDVISPGYYNTNFYVLQNRIGIPSITSFTPTSGGPGTSVSITGIYFTGATSIKFNGVEAASFIVNSDTSITAVTPAGTTGLVTVTTPGGIATSGSNFTYVPLISKTSNFSAFTKCAGSVSASQTFSVSGTNLTADISLAALNGYEYSLDGTTYSSTLSIAPTSGTVATTTIYVRLTGASTGTPSGNISINSTAATSQTIAVSGTVNAVTAISAHPSTTAQSVCQGTALTALSVTASGTSLTYQWYSNTTNSTSGATAITGANSTSYTPVNSTPSELYYYCVVTGTCGTVTSNISALRTVSATPVAGTAAAAATSICSGSTTTLSLTGSTGTIQWQQSSTINGTYTNISGATSASYTTPALTATTFYRANVSSGVCTAVNSIAVTVTVTSVAVPTTTTSISLCQGDTSNALTATAASGHTLQWYTLASGGTASTTAPTPSTSSAGTTIYYVSQLNNTSNCESARVAITVIVYALPAAPTATTTINYCQGATATALAATATSGYSLQWYTGSTGGTASTTAPTPTTTATGAATYYVSQKEIPTAVTLSTASGSVQSWTAIGNGTSFGQTFQLTSNTSVTNITLGYFFQGGVTSIKIYNGYGGALIATSTNTVTYNGGGYTYSPSYNFSNITLNANQTYYFELNSSSTTYLMNPVANIITGNAYNGNTSNTALDLFFTLTGTSISNPCESPRTAITVTINAVPTITGAQSMTVGGSTLQLTGSGTPNNTTPWASSNTAVATVSSTGVVTAVAGGNTTITYTNASGCSITAAIRVVDCAQPFGNALAFGQTTDFVQVNSSIFPSSTVTNFTIETWIRPSASDIVAGTPGGSWFGFLGSFNTLRNPSMWITNSGALHASWSENGSNIGTPVSASTPSSLVADRWTHIALVKDGTTMRIYANGIQVNSATCSASITIPNNFYWLGKVDNQFNGALDEVRFWSTAKTQTQLQNTMYTELVGNETGLLAYFDFNEGVAGGTNTSISTLTNKANNTSNGTLTNFTRTGTSSNIVGNTTSNIALTGAATFCANSTSQYTHPVAGGTWSVSSGATATISATGLLTSTVNENITVSYAYTLNGCLFTATIAVAINSPAAPVTNATINLCQGSTTTALTATALTGHTLQWYTAATGGTASTTAPSPSTAALTTLNYFVSQKNNTTNCESSRSAITVTINAVPTITGAQSINVGGLPLQLTGSGTPATTTPWISSNTAAATVSSTGLVTAVGAGSTIITYTAANGCTATAVISVVDCSQPFGNALQFDGVDDSFSTASNQSALSITGNITLETWIKFDHVHSDYVRIIGKGDSSNRTYGLWLGTNGKLLFQIWGSFGSGINLEANTALQPGVWYHISATRNGNTSKIYINGIEDATTLTSANPQTNTLPLTVGYGNMHTWLKGALDEVRVWNVARSLSQIQQGMYNALVGNETGLVAYYDFNQGIAGGNNTSIVSALDRTTNVLHGTLNNFTKTGTASNFVGNTAANFAITGAATLCANGTAQYAHQVSGGTWSVTNGANATISATGLLTAAANEDITVSYTYIVNGCSFTATRAISINTPAAPVAPATVNLCQGITGTVLTAAVTTGNMLQWYTVPTGGTASTTAPTPSVVTLGTITYYVSQKNTTTNCESTRTAIVVTVNTIPSITGVQNMTVGGATLQLTGSGTPDATTPWTSSNTAVASISSTGVVTAQGGGTTTITYTNTSGCSKTATIRVIDCAAPFGNALNFDGVNDYAVVDNVGNNSNLSFAGTANFTIEAWVKRENTNGIAMIFSKYNGNVAGNYWLGIDSTGKPILSREASPWGVTATNSMPVNEWHHIAATYDGSQTRIYVDGVLNNTTTAPLSINQNVSAIKVNIGAGLANNSPAYLFKGELDEIRVWNVARTATQIQQSFITTLQGNESGLVAYYDFNQGIAGGNNASVTAVVNTVNSASNGTLTNFTKTGTTSNFIGNTTANISISGASNLCANATSQFTHIVAGGTWSVSSGAAATVSTSGLVTTVANEDITLSYTYTINGCSITVTKAISINSPVAPVATTTVNLCQGATATALTATALTGHTLQWYTVATAGTASTTAPSPSTATTGTITFYVSQKNNTTACEGPRTAIAVTVNAATAITVQPSATVQTYCLNATPTDLSVTATGTGLSYQWYSNALASTTGATVITGATTATYTPITTTASALYYYCVVTGTCGTVTSGFSGKITVNALSVGGTATATATTVCSNSTTTLTLTGHTGTIQWQQSADGTTGWANVTGGSGATSATYTTSVLTTATYFRALVTNSPCLADYSTVASVSLNAATALTAQPATTAQNVCINGITATIAVTATGSGITYQWYRNTSAINTGGTLISGATNSVFMPSNTLVGTTYYYCVVSSTCSSPITSSVSGAITIAPASVAGTINGTASVCLGSTTTLTLSGNVGTIQWQVLDSTVWTDIAGATSTTFTTPALTQNTTYRAVVTSGICSAATSANVNVVVNPLPVISGTTSVGAGESVTLTATTSAASSNAWVSSTPAVASVTNTGVVNGLSTGTTTITYTNSNGCTDTEIISVVVGTTQTPVLILPATNTLGATTLNFNYSLPETPLAGSVKLTFIPTSGGTPIVWTMNNATSVTFSYVVGTNPISISNVVSGSVLGFTTYNVTLSYQDAFSNPASSVTNTNIQTLAPPSISFANTNYNGVINQPISIQTVNSGGGMVTYSIAPTLPTGLTLNTATGLISGTPTVSLTQTSFTVTATNAAGADSESFNLFIDADTDGDGIGDVNDPDIDGDGILNGLDICPYTVNTSLVTQPNAQTVNLCLSAIPPTLTVVAIGQQLTYQWYFNTSNSNTGGTAISGATSASYVPSTSTVTRFYYVVVSGTCGSAISNVSGAITISPTSVAGSIAGATTVCSGTNTTVLTLSGNTGTIQWQSSTDNITFTNIVSATTSTYTAINLTVTTYYRAVVTSGVCSSATTTASSVTVSPTSVAGNIAGATTVCSGTNATVLTLSGNTGAIQWQSSIDNVTFTNIASATASTYTATNLTATTYYRAVVTSGVCAPATTTAVTIIVSPTSLPGSIAGATSVCSGTNSTVLTLSGNIGTIQWQWSTDNVTFFNIPSATTLTHTATNITTTTYYRAVITSGVCSSATTNVSMIAVNPTSVAGSIAGATTVCSGTNSTVLTLSGNTGTIQWQSSIDNVTFTNIASATASTYTATNITATTYYRAVVSSGVCAPATTTAVTITVNPTSVAGSIAGATTVCSGTNATVLTLSGNTGTIQWQSSTNNVTFTNITGATASTYAATNLTATTYFRAVVTSGVCSSATTAVVSITVSPTSVAGSIAGATTVCSGTNSTVLTLSGNTGTIQWQSSIDNVTFTNISGATASTYTATNITATTYYRAVVTSGVCSPATTTAVTITVSPISVAGSIAGATTVCSGTNSTVLTLSGSTGTIQWQSSTNNVTFTNITGATASTYTATNISATTYYRVVVTSGVCLSATSVAVTITYIPIVAPTAVSNQQFCYLNNPTVSSLVTTSGVGIKWYASATGGTPLTGSTPLTTATTYYASQTISVCESPTRVAVTVLLTCPVDAIADNFGLINGYAGATTASVLANDTINGGILLPAQIILTGITVPTGLILNANGTITIAPQTATGTYNITYRICEVLNPTNCDNITFSIIVGACLDFAINDCDLDGESNGTETANGTNPSDACSYTNPPASSSTVYPTWSVLDCDGDGVINGQEITDGTSPTNPCSSNPLNITVPLSASFLNGDCDSDGLLNGEEMGSNVNYPNDSNGNGIPDYLEVNNHTVSEDNLEVYSSLTPNGDGYNDVFIIRNIENYPENNVSIYNRWGIVVYDVDGYGQDNKYFKGVSEGRITINSQDELPIGTYFYIIKYKNNNGEQKQRSGYLYINR